MNKPSVRPAPRRCTEILPEPPPAGPGLFPASFRALNDKRPDESGRGGHECPRHNAHNHHDPPDSSSRLAYDWFAPVLAELREALHAVAQRYRSFTVAAQNVGTPCTLVSHTGLRLLIRPIPGILN